MDQVVVYGLGHRYLQYKAFIESHYHIVGVTDKDSALAGNDYGADFVTLEHLHDFIQNGVYILVTPDEINTPYIVRMLNDVGIENSRIKILEYELRHEIGEGVLFNQYSPSGEDSIIRMIIKYVFRMDYSDVRYLELGVWSPIVHSNTYALYEEGARGTLVDANPEILDWVRYIRPDDKIVNAAIFDGEEKKVEFYIASPDKSTSSLSENFIITHGSVVERKYLINTTSCNALFNEFKSEITLLSVDLEGYDMTAIRSIDFSKYRPRIVIIEVAPFDLSEVKNYFNSVHYFTFWTDGLNAIFLRNEEQDNGKTIDF